MEELIKGMVDITAQAFQSIETVLSTGFTDIEEKIQLFFQGGFNTGTDGASKAKEIIEQIMANLTEIIESLKVRLDISFQEAQALVMQFVDTMKTTLGVQPAV